MKRNGKVYFTGTLCRIRNCCDDEMLVLTYLSLHSPPFSVLWRVQRVIHNIWVQPRKQTDTAALPNQINYRIYVYNMKFRQNQFSKNGPDTRLQTNGNDLNNWHCFRILRGENRKRTILSIMIQNVVGIMSAA